MDVVYLVREGDQNEELRHSLRSLSHLPHDRVFLAGYAPAWTTRVGRLPTRQSRGTKYRNTERNLRAALESPAVSDPFVLMNDDFFILRAIDEVPVLHRGPLAAFLPAKPGRLGGYGSHRAATAAVIESLGIADPLAYEPIHTPLPVRKEPMLRALELGAGIQGLQYRTLYGNLAGIGGELSPNVKIVDTAAVPSDDDLFVSTEDRSWERGAVGAYLRRRFAAPSPYERS